MSDVTSQPSLGTPESSSTADPVRAEPELPVPAVTPLAASPKVIELDTTPTSIGPAGVVSPPVLPKTEDEQTLAEHVKEILIGKPRDLADRSIYHSLSLVAFLAWVGLGADGLSSSCYGPAEAFGDLGERTYLAVFLAMATAVTVCVISMCYSQIIEEFPSGGGGYLVASKLLGPRLGVVAGCALLVGYVLTITVSIAAAGDALFGLLGTDWSFAGMTAGQWKLVLEGVTICAMIVLNLRGVKESVLVLLPIFLVFLATHVLVIGGAIVLNLANADDVARQVVDGVAKELQPSGLGLIGLTALLIHAYTHGAGTYTGIEAVSNSMSLLREPRVATGKRTMFYMAVSLAVTAGGLMVAYLLLNITPQDDKTMNQLLTESFAARLGLGGWSGWLVVMITMVSEGALLVVAAQAGFIGGPATLATMARDSWVPHWYGNLSERLATHNGVMLMGLSALVALLYTQGNVDLLVIMYAINVFVTFSLSMLGMCRLCWEERREAKGGRRLAMFVTGLIVCVAILGFTLWNRFHEGGRVTVAVAVVAVAICLLIRRYYGTVVVQLRRLNEMLGDLPTTGPPNLAEPDPSQPTAAILVGGYGGLGIHTLLNSIRFAPGYYKNVVFLSVGVLDSGNFKGARAVDDLRRYTQLSLERFVDLARANGFPAKGFMAIGPDAVDELENLCVAVAKLFPRATFFAGQLVFQKDTWYQRLLHNETAWSLQRRLQWAGLPMVILPTRVK
jgi:amino acid transporter